MTADEPIATDKRWARRSVVRASPRTRQPPLLARVAARARRDIAFWAATEEAVYALSLDDGPDPALTPHVLEVLARYDARASFFLIGSRARRHPALVRRILDEGHEVANHMWRDERAARLSDQDFESSLLKTHEVLTGLGACCRLMRPGSGLVGPAKVRIAGRHGYRCVLGSVYGFDPQVPSSLWTSWCVRRFLHPGAVVILHEGQASRQYVLPVLEALLDDGRRRGLRTRTASQLLSPSG